MIKWALVHINLLKKIMMNKNLDIKLNEWANSLTIEELRKTVLDLVEHNLMTEDIKFYEDNDAPYWDTNGERIDGRERTN